MQHTALDLCPSYGATVPASDHAARPSAARPSAARPSAAPPIDPFSLTAHIQHAYVYPPQLASLPSADLRDFYRAQNAQLDAIAAALARSTQSTAATSSSALEDAYVRRAILFSNLCNLVLLVAQLYAFVASRSLAVLAVFTDALLDAVSSLVVTVTWALRRRRDALRYPVGRARLEPLGVIAMACLMTATTLVTLERAVSALFVADAAHVVVLDRRTIGVLATALLVKAALYLYCRDVDHVSVAALAEDHYNDVLATSVSLATAAFAQRVAWWVDPAGAVLISLLIIRNWAALALNHSDQLLGKAASARVHNVITFLAATHSARVQQVDTVRVYHVGNGLYAEVHIVLDEQMRLGEAHDIGESLQKRIEQVDDVERCFVHLDFETVHSPKSEHKII